MSKQRQYFCPECDRTFSIGSALQDHVNEEHSVASDHVLPPEMCHFLGSSVESGGYDD